MNLPTLEYSKTTAFSTIFGGAAVGGTCAWLVTSWGMGNLAAEWRFRWIGLCDYDSDEQLMDGLLGGMPDGLAISASATELSAQPQPILGLWNYYMYI